MPNPTHKTNLTPAQLKKRERLAKTKNAYLRLAGERDALRALFDEDRSHDDRSILNHMDVAGVLLHKKCGELGFALHNKFACWTRPRPS